MAQRKTNTAYDRYPDVFGAARDAAKANWPDDHRLRILSFGCSTGAEIRTLRRYFPGADIKGCDVKTWPARLRLMPVFKSTRENLIAHGPFDIIFAMSVLCFHPSERPVPEIFSFAEFSALAQDLNDALAEDGILCIYNASYRFDDLAISANYKAISAGADSGFVPKWTPAGKADPRTYSDSIFIRAGDGLS